jgi:pimeloyl-ACP methyl ester carboxylesterase
MIRLVLGVFAMSTLWAAPAEVSFPSQDGGVVYADLYGTGDRCIVLAHGMRFDKSSWKDQAAQLASAGYRVAAIDFRGYGKSHGGPQSKTPGEEMHLDILGAVKYFRANGAKSVFVIGASMGGRAAANAVALGSPGSIDRLILLAHAPVQNPERITGPTLFATAQDDPITAQVREQFQKAQEPKELLILQGAAHAQNLFATNQAEPLMKEILRFLAEAPPKR